MLRAVLLLQFASIAQGLGVSPLNPHFGTRGEACCQCIHEQTKIVKGKFVKVPPSPPELCYVYPCIPGPELPWPNIGNRVDRMCFDVMPPGKDERYAKELREHDIAQNRTDAAKAFFESENMTPFEERAKAAKWAWEDQIDYAKKQEVEMEKAKFDASKVSCMDYHQNFPGCCSGKAASDNICAAPGVKFFNDGAGKAVPELYTFRKEDESTETTPLGHFDPDNQKARDSKENAGRHMVRINPNRPRLNEKTRFGWEKTQQRQALPENRAKPGIFSAKFDERAQSEWNKDQMSSELLNFLNGKDKGVNAVAARNTLMGHQAN